MSNLSERIAAVLRQHVPVEDASLFQCEPVGCDYHADTADEWAAHVAERVAELFTEERAEVNGDPNGGWYGLRRHRWVSEWSAVEQQP